MAVSQLRSRRKPSGGRYRDARKKKLHELGGQPMFTRIGEPKAKKIRGRGGGARIGLLRHNVANVLNPSTKKYEKMKIETIVDNPANRNFIRRNIMTKGAIIKTPKGNARITSRPSQDGVVNAVLLEKKN